MKRLLFVTLFGFVLPRAYAAIQSPSLQGRVISNVAGVSLASLDLAKYELELNYIDNLNGDQLGSTKAAIHADGSYDIKSIPLQVDEGAPILVEIGLKNLATNETSELLSANVEFFDEMMGAIHYMTIRNPVKITIKWGDMTLGEYAKEILRRVNPDSEGWIKDFHPKRFELTGGTTTLTSGFAKSRTGIANRDVFDEIDVLKVLESSSQPDRKQIEIDVPAKFGFVPDYYVQFAHLQMFNRIGHTAAGIKMTFEEEGGRSIQTNVFPLSSFDDQRIIKSNSVTFELANPQQAQSGWHQ